MYKALICRHSALALCFAFIAVNADAAEAVPVRVATVTAQPVSESVSVTGTVVSPNRARLSTAIGGLVEAIEADTGDRIERAQPVLRLDDDLVQQSLRRARAEAAAAEASLADAQRRFEEASELQSNSAIPASEVRSRRAAADVAAASLEAARALVAERQTELARHRIEAPFSGVISQRMTERGEWVSPGDAVFELVAVDNLWFDFQVPQIYLNRIDDDTEISIQLEALPDSEFSGRVWAAVPVTDPSARTFLLRLTADGASQAGVAPGMSARAVLQLGTGRTAPVVTRDAILRYPDGRVTVWTVDTTGSQPIVREQQVQTGVESSGMIEITRGLQAGEQVVIRGNESLQNDMPVRIKSDDE